MMKPSDSINSVTLEAGTTASPALITERLPSW